MVPAWPSIGLLLASVGLLCCDPVGAQDGPLVRMQVEIDPAIISLQIPGEPPQQFHEELSGELVDLLSKSVNWERFCWTLCTKSDPNLPLLKARLSTDNSNWYVSLNMSVIRPGQEDLNIPLGEKPVFPPGKLVAEGGTPRSELTSAMAGWLIEHFLSGPGADVLHGHLCERVVVAKGAVDVNVEGAGVLSIIYLPKSYERFKYSFFLLLCEKPDGAFRFLGEGKGVMSPIPPDGLVVKLLNRPPEVKAGDLVIVRFSKFVQLTGAELGGISLATGSGGSP